MDETLAFLATWVTFFSRRSERTRTKQSEGIFLSPEEEITITKIIQNIVHKNNIKVLAYNICGDHVHAIIVCTQEELSKIVQHLKSQSARIFNIQQGITIPQVNKGACSLVKYPSHKTRGETQNHLWAQKFHTSFIYNDKQLQTAVDYVHYNREKHNLSNNKTLSAII